MTDKHSIPDGAILVAIDIAKARNDVLIEIPDRSRRRRLTVPNTRDEHDRFIELLLNFDRPVIAGFEATGNYHRAIAWRLLEAGVEARLISSMALARTREAIHNGWDKNDPKDAQVILHMLRNGMSQLYYDPLAQGISDLQELSKTHEVTSKANPILPSQRPPRSGKRTRIDPLEEVWDSEIVPMLTAHPHLRATVRRQVI